MHGEDALLFQRPYVLGPSDLLQRRESNFGGFDGTVRSDHSQFCSGRGTFRGRNEGMDRGHDRGGRGRRSVWEGNASVRQNLKQRTNSSVVGDRKAPKV